MAEDCPLEMAPLSHLLVPIDVHPETSESPVMTGLLPEPYAPKYKPPDDDPDMLKVMAP